MKNKKMKVAWAYINPCGTLNMNRDAAWAAKNRKNKTPLHEDVLKSRDTRWLNFDSLKVAVCLEHLGLPAHIFKALEYIKFYTEDGRNGDLIDFLDEINQVMKVRFCVHDEFGKYDVVMTLHLEGAAKKDLPLYLIIDAWNIDAPAAID